MGGEVQVLRAASINMETTRSEIQAGFDEVFWPLSVLAFKAALRILRDVPAAQDVAADVLARLHADWSRLSRVSHREAWVVRAATNAALNVAKRRPPPPTTERSTGFEDQLASRLLVRSALFKLSRRQREAVALHFLVGLREEEVAEALGIGAGSVRRHVARGLQRLRVDLGAVDNEKEAL